jgi:hypothetical protein
MNNSRKRNLFLALKLEQYMAKRVYFAFHYQDVIDFRANVVRKHNFAEGVKSAGYYDYSIWEETKKTSPLALKKLINSELENTSVTVVLVGSDTWSRRWVRYEIFESIRRGNHVFGIHLIVLRENTKELRHLVPILSITLALNTARMAL